MCILEGGNTWVSLFLNYLKQGDSLKVGRNRVDLEEYVWKVLGSKRKCFAWNGSLDEGVTL